MAGTVSVNATYRQCTVTINHPDDGLKTVTVNKPVSQIGILAAGVSGPPGPRGPQGDPANVDDYDPQDLTLIFNNQLI